MKDILTDSDFLTGFCVALAIVGFVTILSVVIVSDRITYVAMARSGMEQVILPGSSCPV